MSVGFVVIVGLIIKKSTSRYRPVSTSVILKPANCVLAVLDDLKNALKLPPSVPPGAVAPLVVRVIVGTKLFGGELFLSININSP